MVVADFGLAKIMPKQLEIHMMEKEKEKKSKSPKRRFTRRKRYTVVGSPYWMAPEMMTTGIYDEKVDIFSYGIVVCEVCFISHLYFLLKPEMEFITLSL